MQAIEAGRIASIIGSSVVLWTALVAVSDRAHAAYTLDTVLSGADVERRLLRDGFHFATLIADPQGRLIFRARPDLGDVNGFGTSYVTNPFLAGGEPGLGSVDGIVITAAGFEISTSGAVRRAGGSTYGAWDWHAALSYDPVAQRVTGTGRLNLTLDGTLAAAGADLNLSRLASNFLHEVPLQTGGIGDTGDMSSALVRYGAGDPRNFAWYPPLLPAHFPFDFSPYLEIEVVGDINVVDTLALGEGFQIDVARKPTFLLAFDSLSAQDQMIAGLVWDESQATNFAADNIGVNHLVIAGTTDHSQLSFDFHFESVPPVPEPSTWILGLLGLAGFLCRIRQDQTGAAIRSTSEAISSIVSRT